MGDVPMPVKVLVREDSTQTLTRQEVIDAFRTVWLEENYNFLEDDLVRLAHAFVDAYIKKAPEGA